MQKPLQAIRSVAEKFKHCPTCKARLSEREVSDILIVGLSCANNHRFFVPLESVNRNAEGGQFLHLQSHHTDRDGIAKDWLTNASLRRHLNNSVAESLRILLEIRDGIYDRDRQNEAAKSGIKKFCPKCGETVKTVGGDGYSVDCQCVNQHRFSERGYRLMFLSDERLADGSYLELCLDFDYGNLWGCVRSFTADRQEEKYIAPQVREILGHYADEFLE